MKKYLLWIPAFAGMTLMLFADDIYTKNGVVFRNVVIVDSLDNYIRFNTSEGMKQMPLASIYRIEKNNFGIEQKFMLENFTIFGETTPGKQPLTTPRVQFKYPNLKLLPVSIISFALSYDYLSDASNLQDQIDAAKKISPNADLSVVEKQKSRKQVIGAVFIIAGIVNTIFVFEKLEVRTDGQQLTMLYNF